MSRYRFNPARLAATSARDGCSAGWVHPPAARGWECGCSTMKRPGSPRTTLVRGSVYCSHVSGPAGAVSAGDGSSVAEWRSRRDFKEARSARGREPATRQQLNQKMDVAAVAAESARTRPSWPAPDEYQTPQVQSCDPGGTAHVGRGTAGSRHLRVSAIARGRLTNSAERPHQGEVVRRPRSALGLSQRLPYRGPEDGQRDLQVDAPRLQRRGGELRGASPATPARGHDRTAGQGRADHRQTRQDNEHPDRSVISLPAVAGDPADRGLPGQSRGREGAHPRGA